MIAIRILLMLTVISVAGCSSKVSAPARPNGVPANAIWVGGADGGSFITCSYDPRSAVNLCTVYNDHTGQIEAEGPFKITGPTGPADVDGFQYSAFDGREIYLSDGSVLSPTENVRFRGQ